MEDFSILPWYNGSMKKGKDLCGELRGSFFFCLFTGRAACPTPFGDSIFLRVKKDRGERNAKGVATPFDPPGVNVDPICRIGASRVRIGAPPEF